MSSFHKVLEKFDLTLKKYNRTGYDNLSDPPSEGEVMEGLSRLECADEDLKAWFAWKRGTDMGAVSGEERQKRKIFMFGAYPISLDAISSLLEMHSDDPIWDYWYIPIATDEAGLFLLFNNQEGEDYGKIYLYSASLLVTDPEICYDSLSAMLQTTISAYEKGILYRTDENLLKYDGRKYSQLVRKFNDSPGYWDE
jgi:hypothetical protein